MIISPPEVTRAERRVATRLAATHTLHKLGLLVSDCKQHGDSEFTAAVDFIRERPTATIAAMRLASGDASDGAKQIIFWILGFAAAREGLSDAVADSLRDYLGWRSSRDRLCFKRTASFEGAEAAFRASLSITDVASVWNDLGVLYFSFGLHNEALRLFEECLVRERGHRYATINCGVLLLCQGRTREARAFITRIDHRPEMPSHLVPIVLAIEDSARGRDVPRARKSLYWYRRCIYSYGWRSGLPRLFDGEAFDKDFDSRRMQDGPDVIQDHAVAGYDESSGLT